jgi:response regulator RpfG family c-di-GMP phosphodiesterase
MSLGGTSSFTGLQSSQEPYSGRPRLPLPKRAYGEIWSKKHAKMAGSMAGMWSPTWVGDRLREEKVITPSQLRLALQNMKLYGERMEEALLRVGAIDETRLLRFIAEKCRTNYVSTSKLAQIEVPPDVLKLVPERTAEKLMTFPVRYDEDVQTLTMVSPDAGNPEHVKQIAIATGVKNLKVYVTRPAAVRAAIDKWYRGQIQSFAEIAPDTFTQIQTTVDLYERQLLDADGLTSKRPVAARENEYFVTPLPHAAATNAAAAGAAPQRATRTDPIPVAHTGGRPPSGPRLAAPEPAYDTGRLRVEAIAAVAATQSPAASPLMRRSPGGADRRLLDIAEILNVLVAMSENARDEFRGHSASVARLSRMMIERLGLDELTAVCSTIAASLHDLGKTVAYHLTALNVSEYATHRTAAQKLVLMPLRLLESVALPEASTEAVSGMYERYDGEGFPGKLAGKEIPLLARILALADTYSDLTQNPRNPYRKTLSNTDAVEVLSKFKGTVFDPDLVDLLTHLVAGEDLRRKLGADQPLVLLVEPNLEEATLLELRLVAQGFEVKVARTADQALALALDGGVHFVLSEVELQPFDGFELLTRLRKYEQTSNVPFLFVARVSDTAAVDRGFTLGAQDYVIKPTSGDVLAAKLRRIGGAKSKRDPSTGVAGSLSEMGLPDLAQIMAHGRKGGRLKLRSESQEGEVHFQAGRIVHAVLGNVVGAEAFYAMLGFVEGTFSLDPGFQPTTQTIESNHENLILEGLRRLDEKNRDGGG